MNALAYVVTISFVLLAAGQDEREKSACLQGRTTNGAGEGISVDCGLGNGLWPLR
ncbi:unnamed protein product [Clavelina lepadiformis]|uniref:Uncharacterized protein n=1 Tax=Clavelina lepadiformis TaxID=159417 RepID=A0ABP0FEE6_CLALP